MSDFIAREISDSLLVKKFYLETGMLEPRNSAMKTVAQNRSSHSKESVLGVHPTFSLVNALVYVKHRLGHSPEEKSLELAG